MSPRAFVYAPCRSSAGWKCGGGEGPRGGLGAAQGERASLNYLGKYREKNCPEILAIITGFLDSLILVLVDLRSWEGEDG